MTCNYPSALEFDRNNNITPFFVQISSREVFDLHADSEEFVPSALEVAPTEALKNVSAISLGAAMDFVNISFSGSNGRLAIYNVLGQRIYGEENISKENETIATRSWPNGTYMAVYTSKQGNSVAKFIVRH